MSNPRIIQTNGQRTYLKLTQGSGAVSALSVSGVSGPSTLVGGILNIPNYTSGSAIPTSMPLASQVGILANGTDQTTALNAIFSNALYAGIIMDYSSPAAVTISGTVNCQGKLILFQPGSYFTGTGTLNNGVMTAGYWQKCFDITISLTNFKTETREFSSAWFGTDTTGSTDAQPGLQKTSDTMIANAAMVKDLYMVAGIYSTHTTWMLYNWTGTTYTQFTLNILGDWRAAYGTLKGYARIIPTFNNGPAIGVQRSAGGVIFGISIEGLFTYGAVYDTFVNTTFAAANTAGVRDSVSSPYCGIAIDPVTNNPATIPGDGGFPTLNGSEAGGLNWYRGTGSNGGTSAHLISNCKVLGFTVNIIYSVNGDTEQGEDCIIEDCFLDITKVAVAYCQTQNDNCHIYRSRSWDSVWTVIDTRSYGPAKGLAPSIHGYNVAGTVNTLFNIGSIKPFKIENFYAESFFTIGLLESAFSGSSLQGNFNFGVSDFTPRYHLEAANLKIHDSTLRYYDDLFDKRLRLFDPNNLIFENIFFDLPPYIISQLSLQANTVKFINCVIAENQILGMNNDMYFLSAGTSTQILYGKFKLQDGVTGDEGGIIPKVTYSYDCTTFNRFYGAIATDVTITPDGTQSASFTSSLTSVCQVNDIVIDDASKNVLGRISNISGTTITISEIPVNIVSGSYTIDLCYYLTANNPCVGDITSGSPNITNVSYLFPVGYINGFGAGFRFDHPAFSKGTYIVSYNSGTNTIVLSNNSNQTAVRQNFINGNPKIEYQSPEPPGSSGLDTYSHAIPTDAVWTEQVNADSSSVFRNTIWVFSKGGYLSATTLGLGSGYQSEFAINPPVRFNGTNYQWYNSYTDTWTTLT